MNGIAAWPVAFAGLFIGMAVLCVTLLFIQNPIRFRRMLTAGLILVGGAVAWIYWIATTSARIERELHDRSRADQRTG